MSMLGVSDIVSRVVEPLTPAEREPAPPLPQGTLTAEPVPAAHRPAPVPVLRILMPVVMVAAMVAMVALMMLGGAGANPMMLILPLMLGMSMLMMFAPPQGEDVDETRRTYLRHLGALREKALDNAARQRAHEFHRHPEPDELWSRVDSRRLWERGPEDADTLEVRIGLGATALCTPVQVPDAGAAEDLDPVCAVSLRRTVQAVGRCPRMPVAVQLQAFRFLGIAGPGAGDLARAVVAQLVVAHGPETVAVEVVGQGWDWLKWLPHTRHPEQARHRILVVDHTTTTGTEPYLDDPTWTTIIDVGSRPTTALGMRAEQEGLALSADGELSAHTAAGVEILGAADRLDTAGAVILARALTRYRRPDTAATGAGGRDLTSLIGLADIEQLTPETMWPGRELSRQRLVVPIGTTPQGAPVRLDLKESAHGGMGPHGLCIGATGSGKSELLRTLVASLAATHSPEELNLVLVDFKGGATFLGCERLPHTSAVITNLSDEAVLVERMFDAISGELNRRQEVLREAGNFANVTDYTTARLSGRGDLPPLPALVIVVDEFSELLAAHPDFAELFVAVGRLGRSLHVHLLLASQRLEEGRLRGLDSHLSYRIGLKTFSAAESRQVLGVTDAHHLPAQPGAGFLKHDAEDITRFQAAYVSGPLERRDVTALPGAPGRVALFTGWEQFEQAEAPLVVDESTTLLDAIVDRACATARARCQSAHQVWLPPLPPVVELAGVAEEVGELAATVGIIDVPYHQRQDPLILDLSTGGGHAAVCGGPQTGKSTALRTIVASLAATHTTAQIRFYVIDLGGDQLATLDRLPHVAGVAGRGQPERIRRIVDEVTALVEEPEEHHTFLVVDGWHAVAADHEDLLEPLTSLAADGPSKRVHLLVSTPRWTVLRPAIRDLITHRLELRLGEAMDSLVDRKAQQKLPALPGRGLDEQGRQMLIALSSNQDLAHIATTAAAAGQEPVPALRVLPAAVRLAELEPATGIMLAVGGPRLNTIVWDPATSPHLVCVGGQGAGKSTLLATVMAGISALGRTAARMVVIDHRRAHLGAVDEGMLAAYSATTTATATVLADTVATLSARLPGPDITPAQLTARDWWEGPEIFLVIDDLDLVADHELMRLTELLPHARDIGLHLVLARKSGGIGRALFGPFLSAVRDQTPAVLLLDADREEGAVFGIRPSPQPPGRGTWQVRGETVGVCQVATVGEES